MSQLIDFKIKSKEKIVNLQNDNFTKMEPLRTVLDELGDNPIQNGILPTEILQARSKRSGMKIESLEFAAMMDSRDEFRHFRDHFIFPRKVDLPNVDKNLIKKPDERAIYLCGQSLGLPPKSATGNVQKVLDNWAAKGVHSHFHGYLPAALCDLPPKAPMSRLVGAQENEIAIMNGLTVNLHLLMATFYRPIGKRRKILIEDHAFPSDTYAVKSQLISKGAHPEEDLVLMKPRPGEHLIREEDIMDLFTKHKDELALALLPCIQFYTGQLFDVAKLTKYAQSLGICVGVDLAHAVGNVPVLLNEWNVDFAAWCTYKYLNSGAGCLGAIYIPERHSKSGAKSPDFPAFKGWWGNSNKTKFLMSPDFDPAMGADAFKLCNPPPLLSACLMSSLDIYDQTSVTELRRKQFLLTGYLEYLLDSVFNSGDSGLPSVEIITPREPSKRGAQLSLIFSVPLVNVQQELQKRGIVCDIRMPSVMRVAPVPLYNSFTDVHTFITTLYDIFKNVDVSKPSEIKPDEYSEERPESRGSQSSVGSGTKAL